MIAAGTPASAQSGWGPPDGWSHDQIWRGAPNDPYQRIAFLQERVDRAVRNGVLSPGEARRADYKLDEMRRGADNQRRLHHGQLPVGTVRFINQQLDRVSRQLHWRQRMASGYDAPRDHRWDR
jgi:hypothetical protein